MSSFYKLVRDRITRRPKLHGIIVDSISSAQNRSAGVAYVLVHTN